MSEAPRAEYDTAPIQFIPVALAVSRTAFSSTLPPAVKSSGLASSISLWLMPPTQGTKIIAVGATRATEGRPSSLVLRGKRAPTPPRHFGPRSTRFLELSARTHAEA